jgi:hypothetical protein
MVVILVGLALLDLVIVGIQIIIGIVNLAQHIMLVRSFNQDKHVHRMSRMFIVQIMDTAMALGLPVFAMILRIVIPLNCAPLGIQIQNRRHLQDIMTLNLLLAENLPHTPVFSPQPRQFPQPDFRVHLLPEFHHVFPLYLHLFSLPLSHHLFRA